MGVNRDAMAVREASAGYDLQAATPAVPVGYKQTEVGVIPEDWDVMSLSDVCRSICDGTHYTPRYVPQGIPFYSVENVTANDFENTKYITEAEHANLIKRCKPERGDILMTRITAGIVGDTRLIDWDVNASIYVSLALLKPNNLIESEYLYRYSRSTAFVRETEKRALTNATPKKINMQDIGPIPIPVPRNPKEQRAIATALSDVDALLEGLDRLIAKKRDLKQAAMQQLLTGQTRLPGFEGRWELVQAGDIGRFRGGSGFPNRFQGEVSGAYPFFKVSDMNNEGNDTFMVAANNYISESVQKQIGAVVFPPETIVFAKVGAAVFLERKKILTRPSCLDNNMAGYVINAARVDVRFMHYALLRKKLGDLVSTTALPSLSGGVLAAMEFVLPPLKEQSAIANVLSDMDAELEALEQRHAKTAALKQAMMQELLTGRTRLVTPETATC
ncbi:restriction endonuclease subunit S [Mangrovitalea sediminis]|uniref:restriction endonuclease subunit S n=1 Tax=Mangrovitalea sediminis TaxID=1982043 RepID=UPI001177DBE0|nr:restriction endonuclease subunit S [Mangrovitalea sediminis]